MSEHAKAEQEINGAVPPPQPLAAGTLFQRKYRIVSLLGSGGSSIVYQAWNLALEENVAIKVIGERRPGIDAFLFRRPGYFGDAAGDFNQAELNANQDRRILANRAVAPAAKAVVLSTSASIDYHFGKTESTIRQINEALELCRLYPEIHTMRSGFLETLINVYADKASYALLDRTVKYFDDETSQRWSINVNIKAQRVRVLKRYAGVLRKRGLNSKAAAILTELAVCQRDTAHGER